MFSVHSSIVEELPSLRRYARSLAGDGALADDLVQDCVERAIDRRHQYQPGTNFRAWLFTILRGQFLNHKRSAHQRRTTAMDDSGAMLQSVQANQESRVELRQVERALAGLPNQQRAIVELIVLQGCSYEEASRVLEIPVGTVRSRLSRARSQLGEREIPDIRTADRAAAAA
jgi:RNA polymerase sigma-70 factor (ECF subfamily)